MERKEKFKGTVRHVWIGVDEVSWPRVGDTALVARGTEQSIFCITSIKGRPMRREGTMVRPGSRRQIKFSEARGDELVGIFKNMWNSHPGSPGGLIDFTTGGRHDTRSEADQKRARARAKRLLDEHRETKRRKGRRSKAKKPAMTPLHASKPALPRAGKQKATARKPEMARAAA
jgi:hypothetical protein